MTMRLTSNSRAVVIYSGGMDSFTLLHKVRQHHEVSALSFDYGQRHNNKELNCARDVCKELNLLHKVIDITSINELLQGSSLTCMDIDVPEGHYTEETMKSTVVPNRNMIFLSLAIGYAISVGADKVFYGAHAGDHAIYPDCRPEFVKAVNEAAKLCDWSPATIETPYLYSTKAEILHDGLVMGLNYDHTWTCYNGREKACGKCGSCVERLEAFALCQQEDPLLYE